MTTPGVRHKASSKSRLHRSAPQLVTGDVLIEEVARTMETNVRSLQRELNRAGTDFRTLTSAVRIERSTELLQDTGLSITSISEDVGYASPTSFTRAFRKATGRGPRNNSAMKVALLRWMPTTTRHRANRASPLGDSDGISLPKSHRTTTPETDTRRSHCDAHRLDVDLSRKSWLPCCRESNSLRAARHDGRWISGE